MAIKQTPQGRARLLKVIDEVLPAEPRRFNMSSWGAIGSQFDEDYDDEDTQDSVAVQEPACGTVACLAGWGILNELIEADLAKPVSKFTMLQGMGAENYDVYEMTGHELPHSLRSKLETEWSETHPDSQFPTYWTQEQSFIEGCLVFGVTEDDGKELFFTENWPDKYKQLYDESIEEGRYEDAVNVARNYVHSLIDE